MRLQADGVPERARVYWPAQPGYLGYDLIVGELSRAVVQDGAFVLEAPRVLARGTTVMEAKEPVGTTAPPPGEAFIYLIQQRTVEGGTGYGTATAPLPRLPLNCDAGCP